jgi:glycosyltransferase involved in cell wall biosynthesis
LFAQAGFVVVFIQNRYLIEKVNLSSFPWRIYLRLKFERLWFSSRAKNADKFIVQTLTMQRILNDSGKAERSQVHVLPFSNSIHGYCRNFNSPLHKNMMKSFIYVASGDPHKNHRNLINAWCILAQEGIFPSLKLTIESSVNWELCDWLKNKIETYQLKIENLGMLSHELVQDLYANTQTLIFPSTFESFGLPLLEARQAGLAILAPELDYVRDLVDPEEVFDPFSPTSIAHAVKRYLGIANATLPLLNASDFIKTIMRLKK